MADKRGQPIYMNPPCRFLVSRGKLAGMRDYCAENRYFLLGASGGERVDLAAGARKISFDAIGARIFEEETVAYVDSRFATSVFPVGVAGYLNIALDVYSGKLLIPVFGGEVHKIPCVYNGDRRIYEIGRRALKAGSVAGIKLESFFAENFVLDEVARYKTYLAEYGYRVSFNSEKADLVICRESVYDLSIVLGLLMVSALKYSSDKAMHVNIRKNETAVGISVSFSNKNATLDKRVSADEYFAEGSDERRVVSGLMKMCDLYSWSLVCNQSESMGLVEFSLNLPIYGTSARKFREETDRTHARELDNAFKVLAPELETLK